MTQITPPQDKIKDPRVIVFAKAFAHPITLYRHLLAQLYNDGRATLTFDHPRGGGELLKLAADELEAVKELKAENNDLKQRIGRLEENLIQ